MLCPYCHFSQNRVVDKRDAGDGEATRRRRLCEKCQKRFTTYERVEKIELKVMKRDGRLEDYQREKIRGGIIKAVEKRPATPEQIDDIIDDIEAKLLSRKSNEVSSADIGQMVMTRLRKLDEVAYLRFASVFLGFESVSDFGRQIKKLRIG